ncbi:hypothetical protein GXW84_18925 [Rhodococcus sp. IEGM 248]|nr:SPFH domain-containing protein [Rhodococcus opacus]MDV7084328.1 SPFH domain-containing protein [Rhodococcus opacus]NDV06571.1 hypothetical protein [Rhodococcus sp. IEGM 248]
MSAVIILAVIVALGLLLALSMCVVNQYVRGVHFRLGRIIGVREPGVALAVPIVDRLTKVSTRIVTMPIQSQIAQTTLSPRADPEKRKME